MSSREAICLVLPSRLTAEVCITSLTLQRQKGPCTKLPINMFWALHSTRTEKYSAQERKKSSRCASCRTQVALASSSTDSSTRHSRTSTYSHSREVSHHRSYSAASTTCSVF